MRKWLTTFCLLLSTFLFSQDCSCLDDYHFIKTHIEKNHGGFNKKIKSPDDPAYKTFTTNLEEDITKDSTGKYCIAFLKKYILYLQDHHSNVAGPGLSVREDSAKALEAFLNSPAYLTTEVINIDSLMVIEKNRKNTPGPIEGIYFTADSMYVVKIVKSKTPHRDHAAVILSSKTKLWTKGQVKLELKQVNDSLFEVFSYLRNHSLTYELVPYKNGQLQWATWTKAAPVNSQSRSIISNELISFRILDSTTTLLSIRSFDASRYKILDSTYKAVIPVIKKYPNLIIDVRNNGGGSDQSYAALMPLIYTGPFESDVVEYYSTPANIKAYEEYDEMLKRSSSANQNVFKGPVAKMRKVAPYSFVPMGTGQPIKVTYPKNNGSPVKIAVLYNRNCASSCESLLFEVMNSSKTIMVGENSGGYTGYGNVMTTSTPCGNQLSWTTTVYKNQWVYEFVGIPPHYRVPAEEKDWVDYTRRLLVK